MISPPYRRWRRVAAAWFVLLTLFAASVPAHGPVEEQIARIGALIDADPGNAALYFKRGELHRIHGDDALALADYHRALASEPPWHAAELGQARVLLGQDRPEMALSAVDRFLSREPSSAHALALRGRALAALGRIDDAIRAMDRAIAHHPDPSLYLERAALVAATGDHAEATARAIAGLDAGMRRLGPVVTLQSYAIDLEVARRRYDSALARLDRIAGQYARREHVLVRRAEILDKAGRHMEAQAAYTEAFAAITHLPAQTRNTPARRALEARVRERLTIPLATEERP